MRRRAGGPDARAAARARRRRRCGAGEARGLPARFLRRHDPSFDTRVAARTRDAQRLPPRASPEGAPPARHRRRPDARDRRCLAPAGAGAVHRVRAAVELPQLPGARRRALRLVPPGDVGRGDGPGDPRRCRRWCARAHRWGRDDTRRRPGGGGRRARLAPARGRRAGGRGSGRTHRCGVVPPAQACRRSGRGHGAVRGRRHPDHARSRRLLAVRFRHSQGRLRAAACRRHRGLPRPARRRRAAPGRPGGQRPIVRGHAPAHRARRPAAGVASARVPVHRRRRPRHVADRRRRHQPGDPGRHGHGRPSGRALEVWRAIRSVQPTRSCRLGRRTTRPRGPSCAWIWPAGSCTIPTHCAGTSGAGCYRPDRSAARGRTPRGHAPPWRGDASSIPTRARTHPGN